jgi:hypothetical protein
MYPHDTQNRLTGQSAKDRRRPLSSYIYLHSAAKQPVDMPLKGKLHDVPAVSVNTLFPP